MVKQELAFKETLSCVQCGYCLPACPTYITFKKEKHSPRGRINLVKMAAEGKISYEDMEQGIELCLGCRACETACPSNVPYGTILESAVASLATYNKDKMKKRQQVVQKMLFEHTIPNKKVLNIVMILWSRNSDRTKERKLHSALPLFISAITLAGAGVFSTQPVLSMILITLALTGMYSFKGPFWTYPPLLLAPSLLAVSIAMINSFGNLGGFVGPYMMGYLKDTFNTTTVGLYFLSTLLLISSIMMFFLKDGEKKENSKKVNETEKVKKENGKETKSKSFA